MAIDYVSSNLLLTFKKHPYLLEIRFRLIARYRERENDLAKAT